MKKTIFFLFTILFVLQLNAYGGIKSRPEPKHGITNPALKIEPAFWWTEMHNPTLQIMIYGKGISKSTIAIDYQGINIVDKKLTDNPNYIFLYINIDKATKPGLFNIELKNGKKKNIINYELKQRSLHSANRESFSEKDNVYLLMPDRFANGNPLNDSVKGYYQGVNRSSLSLRQGGDIEGIIKEIPYLADLGITALWTTPLFDDNDTQYSYHHYAATDYYKIDPRLGTNGDYLRLSQTATKYGIKIIIDVVPNHCGGLHWWVKDWPARDWFNVWDNYTSSNYRMTAWTDPHASASDRYKLTHGWFAPNMPDLNLGNPLLFDYLKQVYIFWIEYAQIAGMRVDTYPYNDIHTAAKFIESIRDEYPKMNVVGECWVKSPAEAAYYQSGNNNKDGFDSKLQSVMDFVLKDKFQEAFNEQDSWDNGTSKFYSHFAQDFVYPNTNLIMNFADNHDINRLSTAVKNDVKKYKMALAILMTVRGYPQIYYGTEIMLDGTPGDYQGYRFDFPGGWKEDKRNAFTAEGRTTKENEVFDYLKKLLHYRKDNSVLQSGKMTQFIPENGVYVFFRSNPGKTVMVICNNNEKEAALDMTRFKECINDFKMGEEITSGKTYNFQKQLNVEGKTVLVLELK